MAVDLLGAGVVAGVVDGGVVAGVVGAGEAAGVVSWSDWPAHAAAIASRTSSASGRMGRPAKRRRRGSWDGHVMVVLLSSIEPDTGQRARRDLAPAGASACAGHAGGDLVAPQEAGLAVGVAATLPADEAGSVELCGFAVRAGVRRQGLGRRLVARWPTRWGRRAPHASWAGWGVTASRRRSCWTGFASLHCC